MSKPSDHSLGHLAEFVATLTPARIPPDVMARARLQLASALAAALGARQDPAVRKIIAAVLGRGSSGPCRLMAAPEHRVAIHDAVVANAAATCAFDWDEIILLGHPGHSAVTVPLALAEARGGSLEDVLTAQVAANELIGRLGLACLLGPQNGQHQPFLHHLGAAAAASKMLGLDAERTAEALRIALAQPQAALWPAFLGNIDSKVLTAAHAAELGLAAAEHAAAGVTGPRNMLHHPRGFFHRFSFLPLRGAFGGLGERWLTRTLQLKRHAACWYFQAPADAAEQLVREHGGPFAPGEIQSLSAEATLLATAVHGLAPLDADALRPNTVNFRLDLSLGITLLGGRLTAGELAPEALAPRADELRRLASVSRILHGPDLSLATIASLRPVIPFAELLAGIGPWQIVGALRRMHHEFTGAALPQSAWGKLLRRASAADDHRVDQGEPAPLRCGGRVEVLLQGGKRLSAEVSIPSGATADLAAGQQQAVTKFRRAYELTGAETSAATKAAQVPITAAAERPIVQLLDRLWSGLPVLDR